MESQRLKPGFTPISNELLKKIYRSNLSCREIKIILAVIRFTIGFNRQQAELSLRFLSEATKIDFRNIQKIVKNLIVKNILEITNCRSGIQSRIIQLNDDYLSCSPISSQIDYSNDINSIGQNDDTSVVNLTNSSIDQNDYKERKKKTLTKNINSFSDIPEELKQVKGFDENWGDWINHRKEIKKPLTPLAIDKQFKKLIEFKNKGYDIIDIIDRSIRSSWQDFYEPRDFGSNSKPKEKILDLDKW